MCFSLAPSVCGIIPTNTVFVAKRLVFPETEIVPRASPEAEMATLANSGHLEVIRRVKPSPPVFGEFCHAHTASYGLRKAVTA